MAAIDSLESSNKTPRFSCYIHKSSLVVSVVSTVDLVGAAFGGAGCKCSETGHTTLATEASTTGNTANRGIRSL